MKLHDFKLAVFRKITFYCVPRNLSPNIDVEKTYKLSGTVTAQLHIVPVQYRIPVCSVVDPNPNPK
jgi:hypothetical protein